MLLNLGIEKICNVYLFIYDNQSRTLDKKKKNSEKKYFITPYNFEFLISTLLIKNLVQNRSKDTTEFFFSS